MEDFITNELLEELGFTLVSYEQSEFNLDVFFGKAESKSPRGMTLITWSTGGHSCTYFGEKLRPNISVGIKKDGGTRTAFNGYCFNEEDFRKVLQLTW